MEKPIEIKKARILVAEDERRVREQIEEWLRRFGYEQLVLTRNAEECLEKLSEPFDVILADMRMEKDDSGFAILDAVQKKNITSAVIIFTANDTVDDCRNAFRSGAWDYISKNRRGNVFDELNRSIQDALTYFNRWGDRRDDIWIREHMDDLLEKYAGQYVAVLNQSVLEAAESRDELEQRIRERKLPLYLTVIEQIESLSIEPLEAELTVFVEGPTDVRYIECAAKLLDQEALLERIHLDVIGGQDGRKGGGYQALNQGFNFLHNNPNYRRQKALFLYDQDVSDKQMANRGEDFENLFMRRIADYDSEKKGIEYLLAQAVYEEGFQHSLEFVQKDLGRATASVPEPLPTYAIERNSKMQFCQWVCDERKNRPEEFAAFRPIFHIFESLLDMDVIGVDG